MQGIETNATSRFDMYKLVHKGLRAFMADVLITVGRIDGSNAFEVTQGITQVRSLLEMCRSHLFTENQFVHTAMEARRNGSACATANDHVQQEEILERIESLILATETSSGPARELNLLQLYRELALFVAENFQHMHVEERDNNETLWSLYTDNELLKIHKELLESIGPEKMTIFLRWILPHIRPNERAEVLTGLQHELPVPVFDRLMSVLRPFLNDKDRIQLNSVPSHLN